MSDVFDVVFEDFNDVLVYQPRTGVNFQGAAQYGPARNVPAWVERNPSLVKTNEGREEIATAFVVVQATDITTQGRFAIGGIPYECVSVKTVRDENGPHHQELYLR